jgi:hypothetical protein
VSVSGDAEVADDRSMIRDSEILGFTDAAVLSHNGRCFVSGSSGRVKIEKSRCYVEQTKRCRSVSACDGGFDLYARGGEELSGFLCEAGYPSCVHEALVEHDGELRLRLCPFTRWAFPFGGGAVQD